MVSPVAVLKAVNAVLTSFQYRGEAFLIASHFSADAIVLKRRAMLAGGAKR
ncbi:MULTISPECIES: hypothetical protein [unclassified Halomonas]|uniref:hypothetical protein n=1 Tax=unclassified Halomonas TaxID=2609666 RepID=UPI0020766968|nr:MULTISPECIES: hypothetical protein [unclassified Halomonas]